MFRKIIISFFIAISIGTPIGVASKTNTYQQNQNYEVRTINNVLTNGELNSSNKDGQNFELDGQNSNKLHRIFIDTTDDKNLPEVHNSLDYLLGDVDKDKWYEHLILGINIDTQDYNMTKEEFIKYYPIINISYLISVNYWNNWDSPNWTNSWKKSFVPTGNIYNLKLTDKNQEDIVIFSGSDSNHSNNEKTRLVLKQRWEGSRLIINFHLGVYYHWAWGSLVHHASLAQLTNDKYYFIHPETENGEEWNGSLEPKMQLGLTSFVRGEGIKKDFATIDAGLIKNSKNFNMALIYNESTLGIYIEGNTIYFITTILIALPTSQLIFDSTAILNSGLFYRSFKSVFEGGQHLMKYENIFGGTDQTKGDNIMLPAKMVGTRSLSYIVGE